MKVTDTLRWVVVQVSEAVPSCLHCLCAPEMVPFLLERQASQEARIWTLAMKGAVPLADFEACSAAWREHHQDPVPASHPDLAFSY